MATRTRRSTSAASYTEADATGLGTQLETLKASAPNVTDDLPVDSNTIETAVEAAQTIRHTISTHPNPNHLRDAFRNLQGFETIVHLVHFCCARLKDPLSLRQEHALLCLRLLRNLLSLLTTVSQHHWGNKKYFRKRVGNGGWNAIHQALQELLQDCPKIGGAHDAWERIFGYLSASALEDESLDGIFIHLGRGMPSSKGDEPLDGAVIEQRINDQLGKRPAVCSPEPLVIVLKLWHQSRSKGSSEVDGTTFTVPRFLTAVVQASTHNLLLAHEAGLLSDSLPLLLDRAIEAKLGQDVQRLCVALLRLGVTNVGDARLLYGNARSSSRIAETLHAALGSVSSPSFIHFDLSRHGYASVELPDVGRTFPPSPSSPGYTLSLWLHIVHYDKASHTTLFGAFDSTQSCFVLVYIEKDTHNLILQTSVTSSKPSVRFKSFAFEQSQWYHVCIVHRRPKTTSSSRASLYVDGEFVEQVKAHYPSSPPLASSAPNVDGVNREHKAVQAFFGTPLDLAAKLGSGVVTSEWRLASACLLNDALSDDLIAVHRELGPRYHGNYQDCLGSFQTYRASAALNIRNEHLHPGREEKSEIIAAIRSKASNLLPESKFLLNVSPMMVLDDNDRNNIDESQLIKALSKTAAKNLRDATRGGRTPIMINGAIASINSALLHMAGIAVLTGDPAVVVPHCLDDASWRIGGCAPIGLSLLEAAETHDSILRALGILFATVQDSWRNSEAMERENGFGVLSNLLSSKLGQSPKGVQTHSSATIEDDDSLKYNVLVLILKFVGYDIDHPENSVCNNPLAYRMLLVDLDVWRSASIRVQKLYYQQFIVFASRSKYHIFNAKRLSRMRIIKKWLDALKTDVFYAETLEEFISAFKTLLGNPMSAEAMRSISLYITYAIHTPKDRSLLGRKNGSIRNDSPVTGNITRRSTAPSSILGSDLETDVRSRPLSRLQVGIKVLRTYTETLCTGGEGNIKKFARAVTSKWLLHLLADDNSEVILLTTRILARLLVVNGAAYANKFGDKTGGFIIMKHRLRRWWRLPELWPLAFAILFGKDVAHIDTTHPFDLFGLMTSFPPSGSTVAMPKMFPVLIAMLQTGLKHVIRGQADQDASTSKQTRLSAQDANEERHQGRARAVSLREMSSTPAEDGTASQLFTAVKTVQTVTRFLADMHSNSQSFKDSATNTSYVQELLFVLFPVVVSSDIVSPETELHSRDAALTFDGNDVVIRPLSQRSHKAPPIVRTATVEKMPSASSARTRSLRRGSSYVLISSEESQYQPSSARLETVGSPKDFPEVTLNVGHGLVQDVLEIVISVFSEQIFSKKDFQGIGLFMKVPPGFREHQAYFESFILQNTISSLSNTIKLNQKLLWDTRVLTNLGRFCSHLDEAVYEGWFIDGADVVMDFIGELLEYLQRSDIQQIKSVRLCSEILTSMRSVLSRISLLRLSELDAMPDDTQTVAFLNKLTYWQTVLFSADGVKEEFIKLLCYQLYTKLVSNSYTVREAAANLWRILLVQKPDEAAGVLQRIVATGDTKVSGGFQRILELDNESFLVWVDDQRHELDTIFFGKLITAWENFVAAENRLTEESYKARIAKRRDKLRLWMNDDLVRDDVIRRHEIGSEQFRSNIYQSEHIKRQRSSQDTQDNQTFNNASWIKMSNQLHQPCGLLEDRDAQKWQLDLTEGRNRMRLRLIPDRQGHLHQYEAKATSSRKVKKASISLDVRTRVINDDKAVITPSPTQAAFEQGILPVPEDKDGAEDVERELEEDFEMVEEPELEREDKNRKVMRSLQRGDQVDHVNNISRIVGLEACEGLLIVGKTALYLLDGLFQRSDGEIVDVLEAPPEERDSYLQMISGNSVGTTDSKARNAGHETRSWRWEDILSISKRRFLFRDVAIEVFFVDGRSYLLTIHTPVLRDELVSRLLARAPQASGMASTNSEDQWRLESLRTTEDTPQTLGSRFTSVFAQGVTNPATRKWIKGEISNFHYLMLVNTMAGRTYNDLTQYPVFPWVLADYTSEELDLTNPRTFRDLTKPMGCQNPGRQAEFQERYQSFAEMGDHNAPAFHYGTHYSSAMIVTSFLIRLQPFIQSYLLLQGGSFDHPDRLFYSIEKAWASASKENMTDVRELIPEFYYLPEMMSNLNGYNFGQRQSDGGSIDSVQLPPWAKGDPKIFITKHREALESDYVSSHLHQWIDLVFGHKQRGDAALEATNVFHHLSYRGAIDLDKIDNHHERMATIGIIHNFGQTPNQVFQRPHLAREDFKQRTRRLDTLADSLTRLPFPLLESPDKISSMIYSQKSGRLLCSGGFRINIPPTYDKYLEWGFVDGSVRFFMSESKHMIGLFEHMHQGQLSAAIFADSRTLITAGTDCTVSVWALVASSRSVDLSPRGCLFGHAAPVTSLTTARSFSTLLSASSDGTVILWDLNRLEVIRVIRLTQAIECTRINDVTGLIMLGHGPSVSLYTLNGNLLLEQHVCVEGDEMVASCAFYEGTGSEYLENDLVFTGHRHGTVNVWNITTHEGKFMLEHVKRMVHTDAAGFALQAAITAVLPVRDAVYTGDDDGRVYEWDCIRRQDR